MDGEGSGEVDFARWGGGTLPDVKSQLLDIIVLVEWKGAATPTVKVLPPNGGKTKAKRNSRKRKQKASNNNSNKRQAMQLQAKKHN